MLEKKVTRSYQLKQKKEKTLPKPQYPFMIKKKKKTLRKVGMKENFLNLIKTSIKN